MKIKFKRFAKGFTLPELLIVMTVLAALAAMMMVSYPASQKRSKDTRRKSDLKQYQTAMEIYYNKNDKYIVGSGNIKDECVNLDISSSTAGCPDDPSGGSAHYKYYSSANAYTLYTQLQQPPTPVTYFVLCSNGKASESTTAPTSTTCPLP